MNNEIVFFVLQTLLGKVFIRALEFKQIDDIQTCFHIYYSNRIIKHKSFMKTTVYIYIMR